MAAIDSVTDIACDVKPHEATLVPEKREEITTEGGLDVLSHEEAVARCIGRLQKNGIVVSLFIDPDPRQIDAAKRLGAEAIEFQTASYSEARTDKDREHQLAALNDSTALARQLGLHVHIGHGLNYVNVQAIAAIPGVEELNIGHSIVSRAVFVGFERAVREMKEAIQMGELTVRK